MKKTLIALTAAGALAAGTMGASTQANAFWWVPAIVAAGVGGLAVGAIAQSNNQTYYGGPHGTVYVQPTGPAACRVVDQQMPSGAWRRVRVCE